MSYALLYMSVASTLVYTFSCNLLEVWFYLDQYPCIATIFWDLQAKQGKNFHQRIDIYRVPIGLFIPAQWAWCPKMMLYMWVWLKMSNSMMIWRIFFKGFWAISYIVYWIELDGCCLIKALLLLLREEKLELEWTQIYTYPKFYYRGEEELMLSRHYCSMSQVSL